MPRRSDVHRQPEERLNTTEDACQFCLTNERFGSVQTTKSTFDQLNAISLGEFLILKNCFEFALIRGEPRNGWNVISVKEAEQLLPAPAADVVVNTIRPVNQALDNVCTRTQLKGTPSSKDWRTSVVVEHNDDRLQAVSDHGGHFLDAELKRTVSDEEDRSSRRRLFLCSAESPQQSTGAPTFMRR